MIEVTIPEHSPPGGPVHVTGLKRREGRLVKQPCGCERDDYRHLAFCDAVYQEWYRLHTAPRFPVLEPTPESERAALESLITELTT